MFRKLDAAFSWRLNPFREPLAQAAYSIAYVPVAILGLVGMFLAYRRREVILIGMLFVAFICVTAVFWAHTSHRSYLDVYWIVFAASVMERVWTARSRAALPALHSGEIEGSQGFRSWTGSRGGVFHPFSNLFRARSISSRPHRWGRVEAALRLRG